MLVSTKHHVLPNFPLFSLQSTLHQLEGILSLYNSSAYLILFYVVDHHTNYMNLSKTWRTRLVSSVKHNTDSYFKSFVKSIRLIRLLNEFKIPSEEPIKVLWVWDNFDANSMAKNPIPNDKMKHVELDRHFIKEKLESSIVKLNHTPNRSKQQIY